MIIKHLKFAYETMFEPAHATKHCLTRNNEKHFLAICFEKQFKNILCLKQVINVGPWNKRGKIIQMLLDNQIANVLQTMFLRLATSQIHTPKISKTFSASCKPDMSNKQCFTRWPNVNILLHK